MGIAAGRVILRVLQSRACSKPSRHVTLVIGMACFFVSTAVCDDRSAKITRRCLLDYYWFEAIMAKREASIAEIEEANESMRQAWDTGYAIHEQFGMQSSMVQ